MPRADALPAEPTVWIEQANGQHHPPLVRTRSDRKLLGVCGGIARRWDVDPTLVRLATLTLFTVTGGLALLAYFALALVLPGPHTPIERPHPVEL